MWVKKEEEKLKRKKKKEQKACMVQGGWKLLRVVI